MSPRTRRVLQAVLYEAGALVFIGPALAFVFNESGQSALALTVLMSSIALAWSYFFNGWFERWEARQANRQRTLKRRLLHGAGFEGGLLILLVPVMAVWLDIPLWQALLADLAVSLFFMGYAIVFTWLFDKVFGLPDSAR